MTTSSTAPTDPAGTATLEPPPAGQRSGRPTRTSSVWVAVLGFVVVLLLLAIFLLQNGQRVQVDYLGTSTHLPLAVAMLLSALAGALLVATAGIARVLPLRHSERRLRTAQRT